MILEKKSVQEMGAIVGRNLLESITKRQSMWGKKKTRYVESKREQIKLKVQSKESKMEGSEVVNKENKRK